MESNNITNRQTGKTADRFIDLLKLFFSVCIVAVHTELLIHADTTVEWYITHLLLRLGVPFFYMVSFFYLGKNIELSKTSFKKYRSNLYAPLLFWGILGLLFFVYEQSLLGLSASDILLRVGRSVLFYPRGAMWYVSACIVSSFILQTVVRHVKSNRYWIVLLISLLFYSMALVCNSYYFIIKETPLQHIVDVYLHVTTSARNGIFLFIFSWIGYSMGSRAIHRDKEENDRINTLYCIGGCLGLIMLVAEVAYVKGKDLRDDSMLFWGLLLLMPAIIHFARLVSLPGSASFWRHVRKASTAMYFLHPFIYRVLHYFLHVEKGLLLFALTTGCCLIVYSLLCRTHNKFIKRIMCI